MKELMTSINANVNEQDRVRALECCYKGWDGSITVDTILEGIAARYGAFDNPIVGTRLSIRRQDLRTIDVVYVVEHSTPMIEFRIVDVDSVRGAADVSIFRIPNTRTCLSVRVADVDYFHESELEEMGRWLLGNFYHR